MEQKAKRKTVSCSSTWAYKRKRDCRFLGASGGEVVTLSLGDIVGDFADAFKAVDETRPQGASRTRTYRPGIGPLTEAQAVDRALHHLKESTLSSYYLDASPKRYPSSRQQCDLVIPGEWAIEFKLLRPFGDNGTEAEHWSENALHPYPGNVSSIGDSIKLIESGFAERKAIVIFGYEHSPPLIDISTAVEAFEAIAKQVVGIELGGRQSAKFGPLIHPVHQQGKVLGWQVLGLIASPVNASSE